MLDRLALFDRCSIRYFLIKEDMLLNPLIGNYSDFIVLILPQHQQRNNNAYTSNQ